MPLLQAALASIDVIDNDRASRRSHQHFSRMRLCHEIVSHGACRAHSLSWSIPQPIGATPQSRPRSIEPIRLSGKNDCIINSKTPAGAQGWVELVFSEHAATGVAVTPWSTQPQLGRRLSQFIQMTESNRECGSFLHLNLTHAVLCDRF
jgi:hypothetical protein